MFVQQAVGAGRILDPSCYIIRLNLVHTKFISCLYKMIRKLDKNVFEALSVS